MKTITKHRYKKCGAEHTIIEYNGYFIISQGTCVNAWETYYKNSEERVILYNNYVKSGVLIRDVAFKSPSSATSFIYGKPCDVKTTIVSSVIKEISDEQGELYQKVIESTNRLKEEFKNMSNNKLNINLIASQAKEQGLLSELAITSLVNCSNDDIQCIVDNNPQFCILLGKLGEGAYMSNIIKSSLPAKNDDIGIDFKEPYGNSLTKVARGTREYLNALSGLDMILNQDDVNRAVSLLKARGICLSGKAGIGKGILANNIGAKLVESNPEYDSYANLVISCSSSINPNNVAWGTGMNNVEILGAIYTTSKFAKENPNTAVVLVLDELFDCDWKSVIGKAMEFFSDKTRNTSSTMTNGETIYYEDNLHIIVTGNAGSGFGQGGIKDERFNTRFVKVPLSGLFESKDTVRKYLDNLSKLVSEDLFDQYSSVLWGIFETLSDIGGKVDKTVSLRALNNIAISSLNAEEFEKGLKGLFSPQDRKVLGWNGDK